MTILNNPTKVRYAGSDVTLIYPYTFEIADETELVVTVSNSDDDQTLLVLNTDYTVDGVGDDGGGNVTLDAVTGAANFLTIYRDTEQNQGTDIDNQDGYFPDTVEGMIDKNTAIAQELQRQVGLCPKVTETSGLTGDDLIDEINDAVDESAASAAAALVSETNAATSETNAATSETNAAASAVEAADSAASVNLPDSLIGQSEKLLKVKTDETGYEFIPDGTPTIGAGDALKIARVNSGETDYELVYDPTSELIQDFTEVKDVGEVDQQMAGHIFTLAELETLFGSGKVLALYDFLNGALTVDSSGNGKTLVNNNTAIDADGIMGSDNATELDGVDQSFHQADLIDITPTALTVLISFKTDDGQPAGTIRILGKENIADSDQITLTLGANGAISYLTEQANAGTVSIASSTILPNGAADWALVFLNWDTTNGMRLWFNSVLEAINASETTLMADGSGENFTIGASDVPDSYFDGKIGQIAVIDGVMTQDIADWLYGSFRDIPAALQGKNFKVEEHVQPEGVVAMQKQGTFRQVAEYDNKLIANGRQYGEDDKVKLVGRRSN